MPTAGGPTGEATPAPVAPSVDGARKWRAEASILGVSLVLGLAIFGMYFLVYPRHGYRLPLGFDASWYVWRARFVASQGVGPLGTGARPGTALLAAVLGSATGRSQLQLAVLLPLVFVAVFALSMGALWERLAVRRSWEWIIAVIVCGTILGTTRLVSENVANLLNLALVVAALAVLARAVSLEQVGRAFWGAVLLIVGAGLAHWVFLAVIAAIVALAAAMAFPASLRRFRRGVPPFRTETGMLAVLVAAAGGILAVLVAGLLNAPFRTFEIREDRRRYLPKLRADVRRLVVPLTGPVAALGVAALALDGRGVREAERTAEREFVLRLLAAWTIVAGLGTVFGVVTTRLPPHRFLALLVAVPMAIALAEAVALVARTARRLTRRTAAARWHRPSSRSIRFAGWLVAAPALVVLAIPGALGWYRHGPGVWMPRSGVQEAETAAQYVRSLPPGQPVVFLVGTRGPAGVLTVPVEERSIRVGMPPERQVDVHVYAGEPADLLASRRSVTGRPAVDAATLPYWEDVRPLLSRNPPILILEALARTQFGGAAALGAKEIAPGVALLRGPPPRAALRPAPLERPVPRTRAAILWAAALLVLLLVAGWGWSFFFLGPGEPAVVRVLVAPALGAAALMMGALFVAKSGVALAGAGGIATYVTIAAAGFAMAWFFSPPRRTAAG